VEYRIGGSFIVKITKKFSEHNVKESSENSFPLPRNRKKTKIISLSYDSNGHVYPQIKINLPNNDKEF